MNTFLMNCISHVSAICNILTDLVNPTFGNQGFLTIHFPVRGIVDLGEWVLK